MSNNEFNAAVVAMADMCLCKEISMKELNEYSVYVELVSECCPSNVTFGAQEYHLHGRIIEEIKAKKAK